MNLANIHKAKGDFEILETTGRSQTAVMKLDPGGASGEEFNAHPHSDQVLLVVEGEVSAEVAGEIATLRAGDVIIVPAGQKHKFTNPGKTVALTFTVYAPPAYQTDDPT